MVSVAKFKVGQKVVCTTGIHNSQPGSKHECVIIHAEKDPAGWQYAVTRSVDGERGFFSEQYIEAVTA